MIRENRTYDELKVGDIAELKRLCTTDDLIIYANSSGNHNPLHRPDRDVDGDGTVNSVAPSMWVASLISAVLGNVLPGAGTLYTEQTLRFVDRARAGDELVARIKVLAKEPDRIVLLDTRVERVSDGKLIIEGEARVLAPDRKLRTDDADAPGLLVQKHIHFDRLIARAAPLDAIVTAVVAPEEVNSLGGAILAAETTIITPILIGSRAKIEAAAAALKKDISRYELIACDDHRSAAEIGVKLVNDGRARVLMKGHLHTDQLLGAVVKREGGLRTGRRLTHVFVMDVPGLAEPLLITDAAINIDPDIETKVDIVQNAIDLAISLGIEQPKVGILSAVETVNPKIPSSVDAAILSKMAERGQIQGGLVDGPLAMDNAIDLGAARVKGITSLVAGRATILVVPNLDSGNMLAKQLTFIAHAEGAGIVLGAKVPIVLTSRADSDKARLASCALAVLHQARISGRMQMQQAAE